MRALALLALAGCAVPLEVGIAVQDITPPLGYRMGGYLRERVSTGTRDPLRAKAMVLRQGDARAALVFCDLVGIPAALSRDVRAKAEARTGIPADHIVLAATHTHTGPSMPRTPAATDAYLQSLTEALVKALEEATADCRPSPLAAGMIRQNPPISFNRRYRFKDGTVRTIGPVTRALPGYEPANVEEAAGPIDPEVGVLFVGRRAALTVFSLHLNTVGDTTVGDTRWSADFPAFLEQRLREAFGPEFVSLFAAGPCGDINAVDLRSDRMRTTEELGSLLASTVRSGQLHAVDLGTLAARSARFEWPFQRAKQDSGLDPFLTRVQAAAAEELGRTAGHACPVEVQAIRLSREVAIVTLPGEIFAEFGLAIKRASPFPTTFVISLANDNTPCYVPTRKAFGEGGYEVVHSRLEPGAGEKMVEEALKLLDSLR